MNDSLIEFAAERFSVTESKSYDSTELLALKKGYIKGVKDTHSTFSSILTEFHKSIQSSLETDWIYKDSDVKVGLEIALQSLLIYFPELKPKEEKS